MTATTKPKHGKYQPQTKRISFQDALKLFYAIYPINYNYNPRSQSNLSGRPPKIKP